MLSKYIFYLVIKMRRKHVCHTRIMRSRIITNIFLTYLFITYLFILYCYIIRLKKFIILLGQMITFKR